MSSSQADLSIVNVPDDVIANVTEFSELDPYTLAPYTTALSGVPVKVEKGLLKVPFIPFTQPGNQKYHIVMNEDLTEATVTTENVWDGRLHVLGNGDNQFNGETLGWDIPSSLTVEAIDSYFTLTGKWNSTVTISLSKDSNWDYINATAMAPNQFWTPNVRSIKIEQLNTVQGIVYNMPNLYAPYPGDYTIKIKEDLTSFEANVAHRNIVMCGSFNDYSLTEGVIQLTTEDGINYKGTVDNDTPLAKNTKVRLCDTSNEQYSFYRVDATFGEAQDWGWNTWPNDGTVLPETFAGDIMVTMPQGEPSYGINNLYETKNAQVQFINKYVSTGISNVTAEENAPVEYFNLQGVRVAEPENGVFIRRQGSNVSKVILK